MEINFKLSQEEAQQVINALAERPLKDVFNLFLKLNMQLTNQLQPQPPHDDKKGDEAGAGK